MLFAHPDHSRIGSDHEHTEVGGVTRHAKYGSFQIFLVPSQVNECDDLKRWIFGTIVKPVVWWMGGMTLVRSNETSGHTNHKWRHWLPSQPFDRWASNLEYHRENPTHWRHCQRHQIPECHSPPKMSWKAITLSICIRTASLLAYDLAKILHSVKE